jgi:hypothetical protein
LFVSETWLEASITTKPAHVEEWDVSYFRGVTSVLKIADAGMKDANDPTVPERVWISSVSLMGKCHKICVVLRI